MLPRTHAALLIVATSRPELLDRRPSWGGGRQNFTAMALRPLSATQTRDLVGHLLGAAGSEADAGKAALRQRIVERSGGNPFFVIELARTVREQSRAAANADERVGAGAASATGTVAAGLALTLPDTVHAAVLAQIDQLAAPERSVLQAASVVGRVFWPATIQALVAPTPPDSAPNDGAGAAIAPALDALLQRDLVVPAETGAFTFRHSLIRDVAYGTLSRGERIRMHAAVAVWLEQFATERLDEFAALIAFHYREAAMLARQSAVPMALPFDIERAVFFLSRAAELASRTGVVEEARDHLERAITLASPAEQVRLYEQLGDCIPMGGAGQPEAYRAAVERWRTVSGQDPRVGARLLRKLLSVYTRLTTFLVPPSDAEMQALLSEGRQLAEAAGSEDEVWRFRVLEAGKGWAGIQVPREVTSEAREVSGAAAAYFESRGQWTDFHNALEIYCANSLIVGANQDAIDAARRRLVAPECTPREYADAVWMLTAAQINIADYDGCIQTGKDVLARLRPGEPVAHLVHVPTWPLDAALICGRWSECDPFIALLREAYGQLPRTGQAHVRFSYLYVLHLATARDDRALAEEAARAIERVHEGQDMPLGRIFLSLVAAYRQDDPHLLDLDPADYLLFNPGEEVLSFLCEHGALTPRPLLECLRQHAQALMHSETLGYVRVAKALASGDDARLAVAIEEAEADQLIPHAARMRIVLAQRTGELSHLGRARPVLARLGDRQFMRRLEEVQAALE
jgi:hypothetical protein